MTPVRSAVAFHEEIRKQIEAGNLDAALRRIHGVVEQVFFEPINTAQVFGSKLLDDLCQEIGAVHWRRMRGDTTSKPASGQDGREAESVTLYIVSKLYASGGHTLALADIIRLGPPTRSVILVTGVVGATDRTAIQQRFDRIPNLSFMYAPRGSHLSKLDWLQRKILELAPKSVWLFNHHPDSVAIAAVQPDAGYQVRFYHHGDHHLCLGVHLCYADHIDMHTMGFHNCRHHLGIRENRYLPLVANDPGKHPEIPMETPAAGFVTCTAAGANKVEAPYCVRYVDVVPGLLHATGGRHIHIGPLSPIALFRIRQGMRKLGLPRSAFVHIPFVSSLWKALQEHGVNLYVASFPYGGARTLIEAMGAGVAVVLHAHHSSRLLSTFDMAYDGAFFWRDPEELFAYVSGLNPTELQRQGRLARQHYEQHFREELLTNALVNPQQAPSPPPLHEGYFNDALLRALDIAKQVSFSGVLKRNIRHMLARFKSIFG